MNKKTVKLTAVPTANGKVLVPYTLRRSKRARYLRLSLTPNGALLTVPQRCSLKEAEDFLHRQGTWLIKGLAQQPPKVALQDHLEKNPWLSSQGRRWHLLFSLGGTTCQWQQNEKTEEILFQLRAKDQIETQLVALLWDFAKTVLKERTQQLAHALGVELLGVSVRNQSTLWGSCSGRKRVSLNWRLILLKPELQDYIIYHELAHLTEMNHSQSFWSLLQRYDPHAKCHDREIKRLGKTLIHLGAKG